MRALLVAAGLAVALVASGCGGGNDAAPAPTTSPTAPVIGVTNFRVYFLRDGQVWPVARAYGKTQAVGTAALTELRKGPLSHERSDLKLSTALPTSAAIEGVAIAAGVASVDTPSSLGDAGLAQVVYTLTQFATVKAVEINGKRYKRADFEAQTPPILVESPLSGETVTSPIHVTGTANTFEATFQYELRGADGKIISKHFEMATSGSGTRGTFDFTVPFTVDREEPGKLVVYESSAEDGSRIHVQEIPLELSP